MLGKLIKYEFKATSRMFLLMYAAVVLIAGISGAVYSFAFSDGGSRIYATSSGLLEATLNASYTVLTMLYIFVIIAMIVATFIIIVVRFYRMLGDEGYLWFTLPTTPTQHLLSKLIVGFVWSMVSALVVVVSLGILLAFTGWFFYLDQIPQAISALIEFGYNPILWIMLGLGTFVLSTITGILMFYTAMSIGPNLTKSRLGGSVLAYVILYIIGNVVSTIQIISVSFPISMLDADYTTLTGSNGPFNLFASSAVDQTVFWFFGSTALVYIVLAVAYFLVSRYFLTRKLNLV